MRVDICLLTGSCLWNVNIRLHVSFVMLIAYLDVRFLSRNL